ncbi:hypothetical protein RRG08_034184 [Elysia crispata]|uniref:Uncharacterized protein n=1 Tax=Elysia crispata TaxID=231223 RepID=A0AAE1BA76_9GAST|nr:hypothetical protein RRG08_034184 [Elysia crispata]
MASKIIYFVINGKEEAAEFNSDDDADDVRGDGIHQENPASVVWDGPNIVLYCAFVSSFLATVTTTILSSCYTPFSTNLVCVVCCLTVRCRGRCGCANRQKIVGSGLTVGPYARGDLPLGCGFPLLLGQERVA